MNNLSMQSEPTEYMTQKEAQERYRLSRVSVMKYAKEAGAVRKIGKSTRINVKVMDSFIESGGRNETNL